MSLAVSLYLSECAVSGLAERCACVCMFCVNGCALVTCSKTAKHLNLCLKILWNSAREWGSQCEIENACNSDLGSQTILVLNCHSFFTGSFLALC